MKSIRLEVESTDRAFMLRLIDWLNNATTEPSSTVVRLLDGKESSPVGGEEEKEEEGQ